MLRGFTLQYYHSLIESKCCGASVVVVAMAATRPADLPSCEGSKWDGCLPHPGGVRQLMGRREVARARRAIEWLAKFYKPIRDADPVRNPQR